MIKKRNIYFVGNRLLLWLLARARPPSRHASQGYYVGRNAGGHWLAACLPWIRFRTPLSNSFAQLQLSMRTKGDCRLALISSVPAIEMVSERMENRIKSNFNPPPTRPPILYLGERNKKIVLTHLSSAS